MKLVSYRLEAASQVGVVIGENRLASLSKRAPSLPRSLRDILEAGDEALSRAREVERAGESDHILDEIELLPVVPDPPATWCVGVNYEDHQMLKNANVAAGMILPSCQDTGTAIVIGPKGQYVITRGSDEEAISRGIHETYTGTNLRYSQMAPLSMHEEKNTRTNLPAQIDLYAGEGDEYHFLFVY